MICGTSGYGGYFFYVTPGNKWSFGTLDSNSQQGISGAEDVGDQWTHVVGTFDWDGNTPDVDGNITGTGTLYVNGQPVKSGTLSYRPYDNGPLLIGAGWGSGSIRYYFDGKMDEVAVYNSALTDVQVLAHYNATIPEPGSLLLLGLGAIGLLLARRKA